MIEQFWEVIQVACAGVMTIGGAGAIFVALYRWAKKPDINRDEKIKAHDEMLDRDNRRIKNLERRQEENEDATTELMRAIIAIMGHAIDGNNIDELKQAKKDLNEFLTGKRRESKA